MKTMVMKLVNIFFSLLKPPISPPRSDQDEVLSKDRQQYSPTRCTNLKKCYYCGGAGILNHSSKLDGVEFSGWMSMSDISTLPYNQCPLCRGTGCIEGQEIN